MESMFFHANSMSDANKLLIGCAWAGNSAFASAGYGPGGAWDWPSDPCPLPGQSSTTCASDGGGNAIYLDRHNVQCPAGSVMSEFRLQRCSGLTTYRYDYSFAVVNVHITKQYSTACSSDGGGNAIYLDRHNVQCPAGSAISSFRLQRCSGLTTYRYDYSCSTVV